MSFKSAELTSSRNLVCIDHQEYDIFISPPVATSACIGLNEHSGYSWKAEYIGMTY